MLYRQYVLLRKLLNHLCIFFFFNDTATTEIYTLSLHDALPIFTSPYFAGPGGNLGTFMAWDAATGRKVDRKSTRLNSSHSQISYAVFCLKKKKNNTMKTVTVKSV